MNQARTPQTRSQRWLAVPALIAAMLAGAAADMLATSGHGHTGLFAFPGFWSLFGLLGCCALAGACKLAARFLKRSENYYADVL